MTTTHVWYFQLHGNQPLALNIFVFQLLGSQVSGASGRVSEDPGSFSFDALSWQDLPNTRNIRPWRAKHKTTGASTPRRSYNPEKLPPRRKNKPSGANITAQQIPMPQCMARRGDECCFRILIGASGPFLPSYLCL